MPSEQRGRFKQKAPAFRHDVIGHTAACTAVGSSSDQPERALRFLARMPTICSKPSPMLKPP